MSASEHDYANYATYTVIQNAMEADEEEEPPQVVYQVHELRQEDLLETIQNVEFSDGTTYELVAENVIPTSTTSKRPSYRRETAVSTSGYWSETDVHRLLKVFLKHVTPYPQLKGKPTSEMWNAIIKEFNTQEKFSSLQIKGKIQRLRNVGKAIEQSGQASNAKWPFWKSVSELLELERDDEPAEVEQGKTFWSMNETQLLLKTYKKHADAMVRCKSNAERRNVWSKIAAKLHRPRYQVNLKFQALKAKWLRWKKGGSDRRTVHPMLNIFHQITAAEKVARRRLGETLPAEEKEAGTKPGRMRWSRENTALVLALYEKQLRKMRSSGELTTRRAAYEQVGKELTVPTDMIQVKLCSLKGHFKIFTEQSRKGRRKHWRYAQEMATIMSLENDIWLQMDPGKVRAPARTVQLEPDQDAVSRVIGGEDFNEPTWFKKYRRDVEKRHRDRVNVLDRLLNIIERIAEK